MNRRLCSLLAVAVVGSALLAGCGSSSSGSTTTASSTPTASATESGTAPATTTATSASISSSRASGGSGLASNPAVQAAVARCKSTINAAPTLSAGAKSKLSTICDEAAKGDPASLKKAESQVCVELVKGTVPPAAQQAALASCPKS